MPFPPGVKTSLKSEQAVVKEIPVRRPWGEEKLGGTMKRWRDDRESGRNSQASARPGAHTVLFFIQHCRGVLVTTYFSLFSQLQIYSNKGILLLMAACMSVNLCVRCCSKHREQSDKNPYPCEVYCLEGETNNKGRSKSNSVCQVAIRAVEKNKTRKKGWRGLWCSVEWSESFIGRVTFYRDMKEVWSETSRYLRKAVHRSSHCRLVGPIWCLQRPGGQCHWVGWGRQQSGHEITDIPEAGFCEIL